jgi:hypothetical protein
MQVRRDERCKRYDYTRVVISTTHGKIDD